MKLSVNLKSLSAPPILMLMRHARKHSPANMSRDRAYRERARKVVAQVTQVAKEREAEMLKKAKKENWSKERIAAFKHKLDVAIIKAKTKANAVFTGQGLAAPYKISANDLAVITTPTGRGGTASAFKVLLARYLRLFKLHGFKQSLFDLDPKAALPFKVTSLERLVNDIHEHVHLFSGELYKRTGIAPKDAPAFLEVVRDQGYLVAPFGFEKLDTKLKTAVGNAAQGTKSVVSATYMFTKHRVTGDALLVEFAAYLKKQSAAHGDEILACLPRVISLPDASDDAAWQALARLYVGTAFGDGSLMTKGLKGLPSSLKRDGSKRTSITSSVNSGTLRRKQSEVMTVTFMLHRLLAGLLFFSKKAKWKGDEKLFVDRMVNAYATILVSLSASSQLKNMYPTLAMVQVFFLQSKAADAMLAADGITTKFSALIKPYVAVPSVRALYATAPVSTRKAKAAADAFTVEKPVRLTAAKLPEMTNGNLAWMIANDPEKLLKLYGDNPQFDLDFSALRAPEMAPLVKFLATSPEYLRNVPEDLHDLLVKRWRLPVLKTADFVKAYSGLSKIGLGEISRIAALSTVSNKAISPLIPKLTKEASQYLVLQLVANSITATKGAFGRIQSAHAKLNGLSTTKVVASDLRNTDIESVRDSLKEAQKAVSDELLNSAIGAKDIDDFTARVKEKYKAIKENGGKLKVSSRKITPADFDLIESQMSLNHGITAFRIDKAFNVTSKAKEPTDAHKVAESVWHGTDVSAASCIALTGFKVTSSNVKAGRSMGSVVYVAPNADKSMQYLGSRYTRNGGNGILFNGPAYMKGAARNHISGRAGPFDWTHTGRFATEEIGLANANVQYGIERAYSVTVCARLPRIQSRSSLTEIRKVASMVILRLVTPSKIRTAQSELTKAKTVKAALEVLRSYDIVLVLGGAEDADRKVNRKFTIKSVR